MKDAKLKFKFVLILIQILYKKIWFNYYNSDIKS